MRLAVGLVSASLVVLFGVPFPSNIREHGRRVTLREGETQSLSVKVVP